MEITPRDPKNTFNVDRMQVRQIAHEDTKLFGTRGISWIRLGLINFIKSLIFSDYASMVREEFKLALPQKIQDRAAKIRNETDVFEKIAKWKQFVQGVTGISEQDLDLKSKIQLLLGVPEVERRYKENIINNIKNSFISANEVADEKFQKRLQDVIDIHMAKSIKSLDDGVRLRMDFAKQVIEMISQHQPQDSKRILDAIHSNPIFSSEQKAELELYYVIHSEDDVSLEEGELKQINKKGEDYSWHLLSKNEARKQLRYAAAASYVANLDGSLKEPIILNDHTFGVGSYTGKKEKFDYELQLEELSNKGSLFNINQELFELGIVSNIQVNNTDYLGYLDEQTGLKFVIFLDTISNNVVISFAPALSIISSNQDQNNSFQDLQLKVSTMQLLGYDTPIAYKQAAKVVEKVKANFPHQKVVLTGFCFGGSLAQYGGLIHGVETHCFNCLALGKALQKDIPQDNLVKAENLITQISVRNEWVSNMQGIGYLDRFVSGMGFTTPMNFGKRFVIDPHSESDSAYLRHLNIIQSMRAYVSKKVL